MKCLRSPALCMVLAVSFGLIGFFDHLTAKLSDSVRNGTVVAGGTVLSAPCRPVAENPSEKTSSGKKSSGDLHPKVAIVSDAVDCVAPLYQKASFAVRAQGDDLRYQWQICDPETDLWKNVSERYIKEFAGANDQKFSFLIDTYPPSTLRFRCVVSDAYGNTATSSSAALSVTLGNAVEISAVDFGADGTDGKDDSAAIQAALSFAGQYADEEHPVTVSLPDGSYDISHTLQIFSHIRFVLSDGAELNYNGDNGCMLQGGGKYANEDTQDYETLTDVTICGGRWNAGACVGEVLTAPIVLSNASDIDVRSLEVRKSSCHFIMLISVDNVSVSDCAFCDAVSVGEEFPYSKEAVFMGFLWNRDGMVLPCRNVTVSQCVFDGVDGGVGIRYINESSPSSLMTVENCVFRSLTGSCVDADGVMGLTVSGCCASDCGAFLYAFGTEGKVTDNVIQGTGERCISLTGGSAVDVTDNRISQVGKCDAPARIQSEGTVGERALQMDEAEWRLISYANMRSYWPECRYVADVGSKAAPAINARTVNASADSGNSEGSAIAVYYSDSTGSVTGNTVVKVDGRAVLAENATSLTFITDNMFRDVSGPDVYASDSQVAVMRNRFDDPSKSVVIRTRSDDGVKQEDYSQEELSGNPIVKQSGSVQTTSGKLISFGVAAKDSGVSYQWYYRPGESCFWLPWNGHSSASERTVASGYWDGRQVCCVVTNQNGQRTAAQPITVTLRPAIRLTEQPANTAEKAGSEWSFSVDAFGIGKKYQWYYRTKKDLTWNKWDGQTQKRWSAQATAAWDGLEVYCSVSDARESVKSSVATASLTPLFGILSQPESVTADSGAPVSFAVEAYGTQLHYRWYYRTSGADVWKCWVNESEARVRTKADAAWDGREICCVVTDASGQSIVSRVVTLTVKGAGTRRAVIPVLHDNNAPEILSQPEDVTVRAGEPIRVRAEAGGSDLRWQWYFQKTSTAPWCLLAGCDEPSVDLPSDVSWDGVRLRCEVRDARGRAAVSRSALVRVLAAPVIVEQPEHIGVKPGEPASFSVKAFGTELQYQWYRRLSGDRKWSVWQGRTASSFETAAEASWNEMQVCCVVTDRDGTQTTSETAFVSVSNGPEVIWQPESVSVPVGGRFTFTADAKGDGVSCQWYYLRPGSRKWAVWEDKTYFTVSAVASPSWDGMRVCCVLTDKWNRKTVSQTATVTVKEK